MIGSRMREAAGASSLPLGPFPGRTPEVLETCPGSGGVLAGFSRGPSAPPVIPWIASNQRKYMYIYKATPSSTVYVTVLSPGT